MQSRGESNVPSLLPITCSSPTCLLLVPSAYFHELFLHGRPLLCTQIKRNKIKGAQNGPTHGQSAPLGPAFGMFPMASAAPAASAQDRQPPPR